MNFNNSTSRTIITGFCGLWGASPCSKLTIDAEEYMPMIHEVDVSFCQGQNSMCETPYFKTYGNMQMESPGIFNRTTTSANVIHPEVDILLYF